MLKDLEYGKKATGTRCRICTGCGRCGIAARDIPAGRGEGDFGGQAGNPGRRAGDRKLQVLPADEAGDSPEPLISARGERLVTADIGTTTIALQLYAPDGTVAADYCCVNPQVRYGADVLSRIQAAENPDSREDMRRLVLGEIKSAFHKFTPFLASGEQMHMVLAGNTTMVYLLAGYDPAELGRAPFAASRLDAVKTEMEGVNCDIFPGQSAFVGGDITAGIYACGMHEREELTLLVDLGTNGEIALGNRERILACATAAGPAFEGGVNRGIWGADMVSILARLLEEGVMDETGLLEDACFDEGVRIHDVRVTQGSVRAVQLAKAAIAAGIRVLAREYGLGESGLRQIGRIVLAGGFGYYLKPADAVAIGLLPEEFLGRTFAGGNTALKGCLRAGREILRGKDGTRSGEIWGAMRDFDAWNLQVINLAEDDDFQKWYFEHMNFPQKNSKSNK